MNLLANISFFPQSANRNERPSSFAARTRPSSRESELLGKIASRETVNAFSYFFAICLLYLIIILPPKTVMQLSRNKRMNHRLSLMSTCSDNAKLATGMPENIVKWNLESHGRVRSKTSTRISFVRIHAANSPRFVNTAKLDSGTANATAMANSMRAARKDAFFWSPCNPLHLS
jgi:hypothetical protein